MVRPKFLTVWIEPRDLCRPFLRCEPFQRAIRIARNLFQPYAAIVSFTKPCAMKYSCEELAKRIDRSLLHSTITDRSVEGGCRFSANYSVASVGIEPRAVQRDGERFQGGIQH